MDTAFVKKTLLPNVPNVKPRTDRIGHGFQRFRLDPGNRQCK